MTSCYSKCLTWYLVLSKYSLICLSFQRFSENIPIKIARLRLYWKQLCLRSQLSLFHTHNLYKSMFISMTVFSLLCYIRYHFLFAKTFNSPIPSITFLWAEPQLQIYLTIHLLCLYLSEQQSTTRDRGQAEQINTINSWSPASNWSLRLLRIPRFLW